MVDGLKVFPYPTERPKIEECPDDPTEAPNIEPCSPVGVCVVLPEWVIFMEMPLVARWDAEGTCIRNQHRSWTVVFIPLEPFHTLCYNNKMRGEKILFHNSDTLC